MKTGIPRGRRFWAASERFLSGCGFVSYGNCNWRLGSDAWGDFSPDWLQTCRDLSVSVLDERSGRPPCKGVGFFQDRKWLGMCFPRGSRKRVLNRRPQPVPVPCHRSFFFVQGGGQQHFHCTLAGPCPGLLCHSWCPLAPAESSSGWPRLHLVRLDYMVKSGPASFHLSGSWCSLAPAESSLKWPRLHLVRIDYVVNSC